MEYVIRSCSEKQLPEILEIFNEVIANSAALYDYKPRTMDMIRDWYSAKLKEHLPIFGAFDQSGSLLGFAYYGSFRNRPAYKYTIEHSVYIRSDRRGKGLGKILLKKMIENAVGRDYHVMVGGIDSSNIESIKLHEKEGFVFCGKIEQSGYKFGMWLDLLFYQLILKTPKNPLEDK